MTERERFVQEYLKQNDTMAALCRRYGIQRRIGYKWVERYQQNGRAGLEDLSLSGVRGGPEEYINLAAFGEPSPFTFGSLGRNALIAPGLFQFDIGLFKNFQVTEQIRVQFRSEFFNAFNNVNFGTPNSNFDAGPGVFGSIGGLAAQQFARQIQFGLKILF